MGTEVEKEVDTGVNMIYFYLQKEGTWPRFSGYFLAAPFITILAIEVSNELNVLLSHIISEPPSSMCTPCSVTNTYVRNNNLIFNLKTFIKHLLFTLKK